MNKDYFYKLSSRIISANEDYEMFITYMTESSHFTRFNHSNVRQAGFVEDASVEIELIKDNKRAQSHVTVLNNLEADTKTLANEIETLKQEIKQSPEDPYIVRPAGGKNSETENEGELLPPGIVLDEILSQFEDSSMVGFYQSGPISYGHANSKGQLHWFSTQTYNFDYSVLGDNETTCKGQYAGTHWNSIEFAAQAIESLELLDKMQKAPKTIGKGEYRAYLAPAALAEVMHTISWGGLSEGAFRKGECGLRHLKTERNLNTKIQLAENFNHGLSPRFNTKGELSPESVNLITNGKLDQFLTSSRTAKEYGLETNFANDYESPRALELATGKLSQNKVLEELGTGLYLSNLHYLNWSDRIGGRITGMTRYACFWVENGEIVSPIENVRFDDQLYSLLGDSLVDLTDTQKAIPENLTYEHRSVGGIHVPGALVDKFTVTL